MRNFRPESHVAQQSRRDKLRVQHQSSTPAHHLEEFPNSLEQLSVHPELNPDLIQVRNVRNGNVLYDPIVLSSEMLNFSSNSHVFLGSKDAMVGQDSNAVSQDASFPNLSHPISSKAAGDPQNCDNWKGLGTQQSCDWIVNYANGTVASESNQNPMYVGEVLSASSMKVNNISASSLDLKPNYSGYQDVQSSITNPSSEISSQDSQKHYGEIHFNSPQLYRNTLQEVVTSAAVGTQGLEMASFAHQNIRDTGRDSWEDGGNELVLLPNFGNQSSALRLDSSVAWMTRPVEGCHQWSGGDLGVLANKSLGDLSTIASDSNAQGLSLSLSSHPSSKIQVAQFGERYESKDLRSGTAAFSCPQDLKVMSSGYLCSDSKPPVSGKGYGNSLHDIVGTSTYTHRSAGPLGPFTGYATILKSSKFLKPAQQVLDEFCKAASPKLVKTGEVTRRTSGDVSVSVPDAVNTSDTEVGAAKGGNSAVSSSTFYDSNEISGEGGVKSSSCESYRPDYQQKKAKLLFMQEEVCRRYKQYHQQMQMVVSSFETVAGLSAATPYIALALKTVSRHFRFLKNAISDQLRHIRKALGEDLSSPSTGACTSAGDASSPRLKFMNQSFPKHKPGGANLGFLEPQQHVWRPQRGLPERAVAILRAWLFEHFLHPYPTDTDKHMLATQTGLSRNQVSNWFINARVRVWKPMVEEVHMLETKGLADRDQNSGKKDWKSIGEGVSQRDGNQPSNKPSVNAMSDEQLECRGMCSSAGTGDELGAEQWNQEKRSRVECQIPGSMDGSLMGFVPYQRSGVEIGGLGAVSLTLGLRHSVETAQQQQHQQQLQQQEDQLRRQFGGQMIHDFVG